MPTSPNPNPNHPTPNHPTPHHPSPQPYPYPSLTRCDADWEDDKAVLEWFESAKSKIDGLAAAFKVEAVGAQVGDLLAGLSAEDKAKLLSSL